MRPSIQAVHHGDHRPALGLRSPSLLPLVTLLCGLLAGCPGPIDALFPCEQAGPCSCEGAEGAAYCHENGTFARCVCAPELGDTGSVDPDAGMGTADLDADDPGPADGDRVDTSADAGVPGDVETADDLPASDGGDSIEDEGPITRVTDGLVALYTFDDGNGAIVADSSGGGLDLTIADPDSVAWLDGQLQVLEATIMLSDGPATPIHTACTGTDRLTVEAWIAPDVADARGPRRIVTLSRNHTLVNFQLGHGSAQGAGGEQYAGRVRSTLTNEGGWPMFDTPDGTARAELQHVVLTRSSSGTQHLYVAGRLEASQEAGGALDNWDPAYRLALANEVEDPYPFLGTFDLVAIYCRALLAAEVLQNYEAGPR